MTEKTEKLGRYLAFIWKVYCIYYGKMRVAVQDPASSLELRIMFVSRRLEDER